MNGSISLPATPAGSALAEIVALISAATPASIAEFVSSRYAPDYAEHDTLGRRIALYMDWHARGGFEIESVEVSRSDYVEVVAYHPVSADHWRLAVRVDDSPRFCIEGVMLGRTPFEPSAPPQDDQEIANHFIQYVSELSRASLFSGAVLISRGGVPLATEAFGMANRDFQVPNTTDTRFNAASLTKSWTAIAVCQLIEAGKLGFDTRVSEFTDYPDKEHASVLEIRHLLSHTSGLDSYFTEEFDRTARKNMRTIDDYLELTRHQLPDFVAGTDWKYSNTGMVLLGKILELVTGQDYFSVVEERVLRPAGMACSGFPELDFVNPHTAVGYSKSWSLQGLRWKNNLFEGSVRGVPAGCSYTTVGDVHLFVEALLEGRLVSHGMVETMTTPKPELCAPDYGYGFAVHPDRALYGHSGGLVGASANLDIIREPAGWVVVVLANELSMRSPVLKARQLIGMNVAERAESRSYLPNAGLVPR